MATRLQNHKAKCAVCDADSLCATGAGLRFAELTTALKREYRWRKSRYSERESGIRSHGGNCFDERQAADTLARLEREAEEIGLDHRALRAEAYQNIETVSVWNQTRR